MPGKKHLLSLLAVAMLLVTCHSRKEAVSTEPVIDDALPVEDVTSPSNLDGSVQIDLVYTGIVKDMRKTDGCDFLIELDAGNGSSLLLEPLTLDEAYRIDGKTIKFSYTDSRRPSQCEKATKPIIIDKIY